MQDANCYGIMKKICRKCDEEGNDLDKAKRKIVVGVGLIVVFLLLVIFLFTGKTGEMVHELVVPHQPDEDWAELFDFGVQLCF